jgi:hypothetical protein
MPDKYNGVLMIMLYHKNTGFEYHQLSTPNENSHTGDGEGQAEQEVQDETFTQVKEQEDPVGVWSQEEPPQTDQE